MHYLDETHIFVFLVQVLLLLGFARALGILFGRLGQPSVTAEILVGITLGPTVFGRLAPGLWSSIFPADHVQQTMLDTVAWLGILFFLLRTGLETDMTAVWRQRQQAAIISLTDLTLPMVIAFVPCMLLPASYLVDPTQRILFGVFVATIMTISALPVTARALQDLNIYRTDVGLLIMCALTINDVAGWMVFAVILGFATEGQLLLSRIPLILGSTLVFATLFLTTGKRLTNHAIKAFHRWKLPEPGTSLTFICLLGLLGGAITVKIGIHALFGFFIAGIMAGESKALSENTRQVISQMVRAFLVPLFFASIGLKVDFLANFDLLLVAVLLVVGTAGRYLGAWVGAALSKNPRANRHLIAVAHVPGGEMQIVISMLALEYGFISETVFVAIVFGALASSVVIGPWMKWALRRSRRIDVLRAFSRSAIATSLHSRSRDEAIRELCEIASHLPKCPPGTQLAEAVLARENTMGTALSDGIALPHARLAGLAEPLVVVGRSLKGIDWNSPDGKPAHLVFLILTPAEQDEEQVRILRSIASAMSVPQHRTALIAATSNDEMWAVLNRALQTSA